MRAMFVAVGSEMLDQSRVDTNSIYMGRRLNDAGIMMDMKVVVGDNLDTLSWIIKNACKRSQLVIITGGLGPTEDDLTREAVSKATGRELVYDESIVTEIERLFKKRGYKNMPEINARQGFVLDGAEVLPNPEGTAPGQFIDDSSCRVLLLPGPPRENKPMFEKVFEEKIAPLSNYHISKRQMRFWNITESDADSRISDIYAKYRNPRTTILASPGVIEAHFTGRSKESAEEAKRLTDELADKVESRMKEFILTDEDLSTAELIVKLLKEKNLTLSVAESCTGGRFGNSITDVPGSSEVFCGGVIAYSNDIKRELLGVDQEILDTKGAVSRESARQMAEGARKITGSDIAVSMTGIAGPGGETDGKPKGIVFMHLAAEGFNYGLYRIFGGGRDQVKERTVNYVQGLIVRYLQGKLNNE